MAARKKKVPRARVKLSPIFKAMSEDDKAVAHFIGGPSVEGTNRAAKIMHERQKRRAR
jgi:hypothetical protein